MNGDVEKMFCAVVDFAKVSIDGEILVGWFRGVGECRIGSDVTAGYFIRLWLNLDRENGSIWAFETLLTEIEYKREDSHCEIKGGYTNTID
jgi:hypothetical protein